MTAKHLRLPNGHETTSDRITGVNVFPDRSLSETFVYVAVLEQEAIVYEGLVDLDRISEPELMAADAPGDKS